MIDPQTVLITLLSLLVFVSGLLYIALTAQINRERRLVDQLLDGRAADEAREREIAS